MLAASLSSSMVRDNAITRDRATWIGHWGSITKPITRDKAHVNNATLIQLGCAAKGWHNKSFRHLLLVHNCYEAANKVNTHNSHTYTSARMLRCV